MTPEPAYIRLEREYQVVAREQVVCGCHVHVGVADAEVAIQVLNRARAWLPVLRALAANSPFRNSRPWSRGCWTRGRAPPASAGPWPAAGA